MKPGPTDPAALGEPVSGPTEAAAKAAASRRASGVLLHPTSLPGPYGIGDLGPAAFQWVDQLARAKQKWWQVLPLGPTGYGDSPYQCFSAMAGNPYLISPTTLLETGLLSHADIPARSFPDDHVDFGPVIKFKVRLLERAWENFKAGRAQALRAPFEAFVAAEQRWLEDFGLFMALKDANGGGSWLTWELPLKRREPAALAEARATLADQARQHQFRQFLFYSAWSKVKDYANTNDVRLIGDIPIFVSSDSSDVWANPDIFQLDEERQPVAVAGVPPDYFSATGQLWGNPLYRWDRHADEGYGWWIRRVEAALAVADVVRIDHFRGFAAYWEVAAGAPDAIDGRWVPGPGAAFFDAIKAALDAAPVAEAGHADRQMSAPLAAPLPIIAEDLGVVTPDVTELREGVGLPGMRVLQFAFGDDARNPYLPHNFTRDTVAYSGTHDNDTSLGWFAAAPSAERVRAQVYLKTDGSEINWDLIHAASQSVATLAIYPLQDVLGLGSDARMNRPGDAEGCWGWRFHWSQVQSWHAQRLRQISAAHGRNGLT
jgi:4-alpha-glucanotransferase